MAAWALVVVVPAGWAPVVPVLAGPVPVARWAPAVVLVPVGPVWALPAVRAWVVSVPAGLPVLGICRGMQLMAVHAGGSLDQHTPDLVGHETHSPGGDAYGSIGVTTEAGSRLSALVGASVEVGVHGAVHAYPAPVTD